MRPRVLIWPTSLVALLALTALVLGVPAHGRDASGVAQSPRASLRKQITRLERRIATGEIRVPSAFPDPR